MSNITCGDNTAAFGGRFLRISLNNETGLAISKAVFACGSVRIEFKNPVFPLIVNLTEEQSSKLNCNNTCYLAVWDEDGRKRTCEGSLNFNTNPRKV